AGSIESASALNRIDNAAIRDANIADFAVDIVRGVVNAPIGDPKHRVLSCASRLRRSARRMIRALRRKRLTASADWSVAPAEPRPASSRPHERYGGSHLHRWDTATSGPAATAAEFRPSGRPSPAR